MSPRRAPAAPGRGEEPQPAPADEQTAVAAPPDAEADAEDLEEPASSLDLVEKLLPDSVQKALKLNPAFAALLAEACYVFGINPNPALKPRELAGLRLDLGEPDGVPAIPPSVVMVTAGGLKIRYPIDAETNERLHLVYNAYRVGKDGKREVLPLPADLTLPRASVDGQVRSTEHQYTTGYLREGGREAANRKAKLAELRGKGRLGQ